MKRWKVIVTRAESSSYFLYYDSRKSKIDPDDHDPPPVWALEHGKVMLIVMMVSLWIPCREFPPGEDDKK
jgi:hypothetical protein